MDPKSAPPGVEEQFLEKMACEFVGWGDPVARLRQALEKGELLLYLQPIADLQKRRFIMAEALVRLREEERLMLPPGEFLPAFEHYGMMPQLDRWVVEQIVHRLARGSAGGFRQISINVSGQTLADAGFPPEVGRMLADFGVPPEALCFEIEEGDVLHRLDVAAAFARQIRDLRCKAAIHGFGRRATSFAPLKALRVDFIKVDGSITRNVTRNEQAVRKMQAIVRVAEAINVGVIAEFVEETDTVAKLLSLGVGYAQGFGIARPAPIDEAPAR